MNLSVSNLAWHPSKVNDALSILKKYKIHNIDIVPTLVSNSIENIDAKNILNFYKSAEITIVGMQSLLFSCPPVSLFDGEDEKKIIFNHLKKIFNIANKLKIKKLVFGSPKNRFIQNGNNFSLPNAIDTFKEISYLAETFDCIVCLEANPKEYNCNFITSTTEAISFINRVAHKNLKLNLDISTIILNNEQFKFILDTAFNLVEHVHISSPFLKDIHTLKNKDISSTLKQFNYNKYIVLECNFQNNKDLVGFENNIALFKEEYN